MTKPRQNHAQLVTAYRIPVADFCTLRSEEVERVLAAADSVGYRRPANANGSRGRYFHARLMRDLERAKRFPVVHPGDSEAAIRRKTGRAAGAIVDRGVYPL